MGNAIEILVNDADPAGSPVVIGLPFRPGDLHRPEDLAVSGPGGELRPAAVRRLVPWPDGSTRWALLAFTAAQAGTYQVSQSTGVRADFTPVAMHRGRDGRSPWVLDNGRLRVVLNSTGPGPVGPVLFHGQPILADASQMRLCVDDAATLHEQERRLFALEENPVRVRVRIEGALFCPSGQRRLHYRLDVELWAGMPALRLDCHVFHKEPGRSHLEIRRLALDCELDLAEARTRRQTVQLESGIFQEPRDILNPSPVTIVCDHSRAQPHVEDVTMFLDAGPWPAFLNPPPVRALAWLGLTDGDLSVAMAMQDLQNMPPKRIASAGRRLSLEFWPGRAGALRLPQGRSRRHVVTLAFGHGPFDRHAVSRLLAAPWWEGRACLAPHRFAHCGAFDQDKLLVYGAHARFERFLARLVQIETPSNYFDLGDTPDAGYTRSYPSVSPTHVPLKPGAPVRPRSFLADDGQLASWHPTTDFEPVWVNNEYDGIHAVASELMRTGRPTLWPLLRRMARHNIEVDFWHYHDEPWLHQVSAVHSAGHATSGGYPSHFWTEGLMEYYCLTGDPDVLEVAVALGDAVLRFFHDPERGKFYRNWDRELGWALLALVSVYDIVREPRFAAEIDRLVGLFMAEPPETGGFRLTPRLVEALYFMLNVLEAFDRYQRITGRPDLHDWLVRILRPLPGLIEQNYRNGRPAYSTPAALAILYERTGDPAVLRPGMVVLEDLIADDPRWQAPVREVKPMAILYRSFIRWFGHAERAGLLGRYEYRALAREEPGAGPSQSH